MCPKILKQQTGIVKHVVINMAPCISGIIHILKFVRRMNKKIIFLWKKVFAILKKIFAKKHTYFTQSHKNSGVVLERFSGRGDARGDIFCD